MLVFKFCYSNFASSRYYDWIKNSTNATCDTIRSETTATTSQNNNFQKIELGALIGFVILFVCLTASYLIYIYIEQKNKNRMTVERSIQSLDRDMSNADIRELDQQSDKQPDKLVKSKSSKDTSQKVKSISTKVLKQKSIGKIKVNLPLKAVKNNIPKI